MIKGQDSVIFVCFTSYQLLNAVYYAKVTEGKAKRILIWHNYTKYKIDISQFKSYFEEICSINNFYDDWLIKRQFFKCLYGGWLFNFSKIYRIISKSNLSQTILVIFSDQHIISRRIITQIGNNIKNIILVEEGLATYLIRNKTIPRSRDWLINLFLGARYEPYIGANKFIKTIFVKHPEMLLEEKKMNRTIIQQNNIFQDDMWKTFFGNIIEQVNISIPKNKKILLWIGQPLEMDGIDTRSQISWLKDLSHQLGEQFSIIIKQHPREEKTKYSELKEESIFQLQLEHYNWIPIEVFASIICPDVIMTVYSTAANNILETGVNCKVIYCYKHFGLSLGNHDEMGLINRPNTFSIENWDDIKSALKADNVKPSNITINRNKDIQYLTNILAQ